MDIADFMNKLGFLNGENIWIAQVFLVVFCALCLDYVQRKLLKRLDKKLESTQNPWDDAVVRSLRKPLSVLIWVVGVTFGADIIFYHTQAEVFAATNNIRYVGIIGAVAWFLVRLVDNMESNIVAIRKAKGKPVDITTADAVAKLFRVSIIITAALVTLQTLGFSISGVLAFGGIGGIAIGFAAKDLLANFFGGLMIYLDRPFSVGDWIRSPDRNIEGTVETIGWRLTTIRTFDKRPLYVPNAVFNNVAVENPSRMTNRRIYETIGIRYDDVAKMGAIVADVKSMLLQHPEIDTSRTLIVNFNAFSASSLDFFVYTFTKTKDWILFHEIKQDVMLKISDIISAHEAEIAFPTSTLHVPESVHLDQVRES